MASKDARAILEEFTTKVKWTLKGVGEPSYYLWGNFGRVPTTLIPGKKSTCFLSVRTYIKNICKKIEEVFKARLKGRGLKSSHTPMSPEYRPETDDSPLLSPEDGSRYRMLVGSALWATTLGRHDILYATSTFARYNAIPREGHLLGMLRVFGYLKCHSKAKLVFDTRDFMESDGEEVSHGWGELHPSACEELPHDMPVLKMKPASISSIYDANHAPCLVTRRSVSGIVLLLNNTILRCTSKRQNTVESATYGAEMVAGRLAVEQVMDIRYKLRMLGVPVLEASVLIRDDQSIITSCSIPNSNLKKMHNSIAYLRIREAVAAGIVKLKYVKSKWNLADAMTKTLAGHVHYALWKAYLLKPLQEKGAYQHAKMTAEDMALG